MAFVSIAFNSWRIPGVSSARDLFRHLGLIAEPVQGTNPSRLYENVFQRTMLVKKIGYVTKKERSVAFELTLQQEFIN